MSDKVLELFKNTFGAVVDIKGNIRDIIILLNNPTSYKAMAEGTIDPEDKATLMSTFQKGKLEFEVGENDCFCVSLVNKMFIQSQKINVITDGPNAYIEEVILAFPGIDMFKSTINFIKETYNLDVVDLTGTISQYEGFDQMIQAYLSKKNA